MGNTGELQGAERYFISPEAIENAVVTLRLTELCMPAHAEHLLTTYASMLGTEDKRIAAAIFCTWIAGICGVKYALLTAADPLAHALRLNNLSVQLIRTEGYPEFAFFIHDQGNGTYDQDGDGKELSGELGMFYSSVVRPVIDALAEASQTKAVMLWKHVYNQLYTFIEEDGLDAPSECSRTQIHGQFQAAHWELTPEVFGLRSNPFRVTPKFRTDPHPPHDTISVKATCCLAYKLRADHSYCSSCPILPAVPGEL
ncbi:(2Fe-2S)-binding protein [Paenibacillus silagei]|uniref:Ferric iron reductase protein FhuF n=1 Tax=Paenibacillus silagei TaxID=1670801 RepID=A0ABS4NR12_9BACL|nr:(2Fe-2S)-binding protein [Paenibacillus silagei]MBP2112499.1 ferric iron reductase protein FhuF [Paenibacillus silagei]